MNININSGINKKKKSINNILNTRTCQFFFLKVFILSKKRYDLKIHIVFEKAK